MYIHISLPGQFLELYDARQKLLQRYCVSTALRGAGEINGSQQTPRGRHVIRARIGDGLPAGSVFKARRPTGEIWTAELAAVQPQRDWILTRILWLSGCEPGRNRLGMVDTMRRYVYIHGCPPSATLGQPGSIGCVRMGNTDLIDLFARVLAQTIVDIEEFRVISGDWRSLETAAKTVRKAVFIDEQGIAPELEWDDLDREARHVLALDEQQQAIGTGRLLIVAGTDRGRIGRLAVLPAWRGRRVGGMLLRRLLDQAVHAGLQNVHLHARLAARGFYENQGFKVQGKVFDEVGQPHVLMQRKL